MLLAIDAATRCASIALYDRSGVVYEASWRTQNNHSVEVLPAIAQALSLHRVAPSALRAVATTQGPGSFTGLRIGMSVAKGLCLALGLPIIAVPTLDVVAYAIGDPGTRLYAVLEAGRGRICVAPYRFEAGMPVQDGKIELVRTDEWVLTVQDAVFVAGEISPELADRLEQQPNAGLVAITSLASSPRRAGYLAEIAWNRLEDGKVDDVDRLEPLYTQLPTSGTQV